MFQQLLDRLPRIARAQRPTLLTGETGSGKEMVARHLHQCSPRANQPFVAVNCGAIPEALFEAEFFGHVRGAFTGAATSRHGLVGEADGGTLFLDEINSLPPIGQVKLLRFLETGEYRAVGSAELRRARCWVIAATNADLSRAVEAGSFRADLLHRLDAIRVCIPSLRERGDDVQILADLFLQDVSAGAGWFTPEARRALAAHTWPGNVRELRNRVEAAALLADGERVDADLLGLEAKSAVPVEGGTLADALRELVSTRSMDLPQALAYCEHVLLEEALALEGGNRTRAARRLGIHVRTIFKKLSV